MSDHRLVLDCARAARRGLLVAAVLCVAAAPALAQDLSWPTAAWTRSTPAAEGLDPARLLVLVEAVQSGTYGYVDRVVVVRHGRLVLSERFEHDYRRISRGHTSALGCGWESCPEGAAAHPYNYLHPDTHPYWRGRDVHSLQSVTKSVAATVLAVAIHRGEIPGVGARLLDYFSEYDLSGVDARLQRATLEDLLTMRSGIEWHEQDRPFDQTNTTLQLEQSADWIQFTLDQPMDAVPGEKWVYNSGGSHLMSGVVRGATGRHLHEYAREHLFGPLGIDDFHWKTTPRGYADTEGGLYLEAEDLARIGLLYLRDGVWDGSRLLPEGWVRAATALHVPRTNGTSRGYGYQWWRPDRGGVEVWAGFGFGGQYLIVLPEYDIVGVVNSWNLFGGGFRGMVNPFIDALIEAAGG